MDSGISQLNTVITHSLCPAKCHRVKTDGDETDGFKTDGSETDGDETDGGNTYRKTKTQPQGSYVFHFVNLMLCVLICICTSMVLSAIWD